MSESFFDGFAWAVPTAFSEAVSTCMFLEGDTLYDTKKAYSEEWGKALSHIRHYLQVLSTAANPNQSEDGVKAVFVKNWASEVTVQLTSFDEGEEKKFVQTTQGRLYSLLWHGDISVLSTDTPKPKTPVTLREVAKRLEEVVPFARKIAGDRPVFIMARDLCNNISTNKHFSVESTLHRNFKAKNHTHIPKVTGLADWQRISPTIVIVFFIMEQGNHDEIHDALKKLIYTPAKDAKTDMFRLTAHGLLIAD